MAITTNTHSNASGICNFVVGKIVTDGGASSGVTVFPGFAPRKVKFVNLTDRIVDEWFEGMGSASSLHTVAAGTMTLEATNGITVSVKDRSFSVNAATLLPGKTFYWEAIA